MQTLLERLGRDLLPRRAALPGEES